MTNEEQRKAFASYMGTASSGGGQPVPEYPGAVAQPGNPFLYSKQLFIHTQSPLATHSLQQFPGLQIPPAVPTPPLAASSSVASYPAYQGGFPQGGFAQGGFGQNAFPQRPPVLGASEASQGQQSMRPPIAPAGYTHLSRNYASQPPPPSAYSVSHQYTDTIAPLNRQGSTAAGTMTAPHAFSGEVIESRQKQTNEYYHYHQQGCPPVPSPQIENLTVPVLLCHTCSECGGMRSAGFHRNNPVIPGKPLVTTPCRKCKKKIHSNRRSDSRYTRIRTCIADEPCDWPRESVRVDINGSEHRGRHRSRDKVYAARYSPSRPRMIREGTSQTRMGLRTLQRDRSPPHVLKEVRVRVSSLSPCQSSRYGEVWPPPDVVHTKPRSEKTYLAADQPPHPVSRSDEVWPPPDVVRTHPYRKISPIRQSSRIIELSSSPPPMRSRSTRFVYRSDSQERRPRSRSASPVRGRVSVREERRSDAEIRMASHPRAYRAVMPDHRDYLRESDETSTNLGSVSQGYMELPSQDILKPSGRNYETVYRRRATLRDSQQNTSVHVGGSRVQFASERNERPVPESTRAPAKYIEDEPLSNEDYEHYHRYSRHRYFDERSPSPPTRAMDSMRIQQPSLSPSKDYEEIRIDRARRIFPSPPPSRRYEKVRVRHVFPNLPPSRDRTSRLSTSPPLLERSAFSSHRDYSRTQIVERAHSLTPPPSRKEKGYEELTDSDSAYSGEVTEVRRWKGIDENGKPATFVEERRTVRMIDQGSERESELRPLTERLAAGSWRDV